MALNRKRGDDWDDGRVLCNQRRFVDISLLWRLESFGWTFTWLRHFLESLVCPLFGVDSHFDVSDGVQEKIIENRKPRGARSKKCRVETLIAPPLDQLYIRIELRVVEA